MGSSNKPQTIGHRYFMGIHMGLCRGPINELLEIQAGGRTAWKGSAVGQARWQIAASSLFGGDQGEGGIYGTIDLMLGTETQPVNPRLQKMLGSALVPAFRGITTLFYDGLICSMNPYPKPWKFRVRRVTSGWDNDAVWYPEKSVIWMADNKISAENPAHMIYEAITNRDWGRGRPAARIHDASFRAAADQLFAEGFGLCLCWRRQDGIGALVKAIIDHIGAVLIDDLQTGQVSLKLIRGGYVVDNLPIFDEETGLLGIDDDQVADGAAATNEIIVKFKNVLKGGDDDMVRVQNNAAIQSVGSVRSETIDYPMVPDAGLALRLAQRELRARGTEVRRLKVRLDRRGSGILPGAVFRVKSPKRGYEQLVLLAGQCDYGTLEAGTLTISAMVDVFGLPATTYVQVQEPTVKPPSPDPLPATIRKAFEIPYREFVRFLPAEQLSRVTALSCGVGIIARRPSAASIDYTMLTKVGAAAWGGVDQGDWCPTAQIATDLDYLTTSTRITYATDMATVVAGEAAMIDDEIVRVVSFNIDTGDLVIARGCADTLPAKHAKGARIWFYGADTAVDPADYAPGVPVQIKVQSRTSTGLLDLALAATDSLTTAQRQARPYPPGNVKVNASTYPLEVTGEVMLTWAHRDRISQADQLVDAVQGNIGPEAGTEYRLRFYSGALLKRTVTVAGNAYTYSLVDEFLDGGPFSPLRVVLDSVRGGLYSTQSFDLTVSRLGLPTAPPVRLSVTQSAFAADTTAHLVTAPAVVAGDMLLLQFTNDGNATVATPAGWTLLNSTLSSGQVRSSWFYRVAAGAEGSTTVDLVTSTAEQAAAQVHRIKAGTFAAGVAPVVAVATGGNATPTPPALTAPWGIADTLWIAAYGADDDDATTAWPLGGGQTYTPSGTGTTSASVASCIVPLKVATLAPGAFTIESGEEWVAATVAIRPAP